MDDLVIGAGTEWEETVKDVRQDYRWATPMNWRTTSPHAFHFLHHTVSRYFGGDFEKELAHLRHLADTSPYRLPYNFITFQSDDATIFYLNDIDKSWAHTYAHHDDIATCVVGNFENDVPTQNLLDRLYRHFQAIGGLYLPNPPAWLPHSAVYPTACPGQNLRAAFFQ
jgi:hypothetical protein